MSGGLEFLRQAKAVGGQVTPSCLVRGSVESPLPRLLVVGVLFNAVRGPRSSSLGGNRLVLFWLN